MIGQITESATSLPNPSIGLPIVSFEVFDLIGRGLTTREIAAQLGLGITTVDTYRTRIREKLNLENSARLRVAASRWVQMGDRPTG